MFELVKQGYSPHRAFERACAELGLVFVDRQEKEAKRLAQEWVSAVESKDLGTAKEKLLRIARGSAALFNRIGREFEEQAARIQTAENLDELYTPILELSRIINDAADSVDGARDALEPIENRE
jgi:hypothetical protein